MGRKNIKTVSQRIEALEKFQGSDIPGTNLSRVLNYKGVEWCLAIGALNQPKLFFYSTTIDECLSKAEKALFHIKPNSM